MNLSSGRQIEITLVQARTQRCLLRDNPARMKTRLDGSILTHTARRYVADPWLSTLIGPLIEVRRYRQWHR